MNPKEILDSMSEADKQKMTEDVKNYLKNPPQLRPGLETQISEQIETAKKIGRRKSLNDKIVLYATLIAAIASVTGAIVSIIALVKTP